MSPNVGFSHHSAALEQLLEIWASSAEDRECDWHGSGTLHSFQGHPCRPIHGFIMLYIIWDLYHDLKHFEGEIVSRCLKSIYQVGVKIFKLKINPLKWSTESTPVSGVTRQAAEWLQGCLGRHLHRSGGALGEEGGKPSGNEKEIIYIYCIWK